MKLLLVADGFEAGCLGAADGWMAELAACLAARGHRVTAVCARSLEPWQQVATLPGVAVWHPPVGGFEASLDAALAQRPDVVHVAVPGGIADAAAERLLGAPLLVDLHDHAAYCAAGDLEPRPGGGTCPLHHPHARCPECAGAPRVRAVEPRQRLAKGARVVVAHAAFTRDRATRALARPVALVPYGADPRRFSPEPAPAIAPAIAALAADRAHPRVLLLGAPTPGHGGPRAADLLVALQARVAGVELVVAGRDAANPDAGSVLGLEARELGLSDQLALLPSVAPADLPALLAACDVGVAPGLAPEAGGLAIVQALAAGLAIVAHPAGAVPELLQEGACGRLADARGTGPFADAVAALLADRPAREALSAAARLAAIERFDLERSLFAIEELYARVAGRAAAGRPPGDRARRAA